MTQAILGIEDVHEHYRRTAENRNLVHRRGFLTPHRINHGLRGGLFRRLLGRIGPVETALDIGTGTGVWAELLAQIAQSVVGVDFVEENLSIARQNAARTIVGHKIRYLREDARTLASLPDESFDLAMQVSVLQHLGDAREALGSVCRVLRPGGRLLLLVHNKNCFYNRNLRRARREGGIRQNEYSRRGELLGQLRDCGLEPQKVRGNWLFVNDLLLVGRTRRALLPLAPARWSLLKASQLAQRFLSGRAWANRCFREIVVLARKDSSRP
jgi:SAM-dependent methyltransferase